MESPDAFRPTAPAGHGNGSYVVDRFSAYRRSRLSHPSARISDILKFSTRLYPLGGSKEVKLRTAALPGAGFLLAFSACAAPPLGGYSVQPVGPPNQAINCNDPRAAFLCGRATAVPPGPAGFAASVSDCPEGREIRRGHAYDTRLSDCEVLATARKSEEDSRLSEQRAEQTRIAEEKRARDEQQRRIEEDRSLGYAFVSSEDFLLDGKQLARTEANQGMYVKTGTVERLFPSQMAVIMAMQGATSAATSVILLTDEAPRELRAYFLRCGSLPGRSQLGCAVRVRGRATTCERATVSGAETIPCLVVDGGQF
jgi:hypothetical protein